MSRGWGSFDRSVGPIQGWTTSHQVIADRLAG